MTKAALWVPVLLCALGIQADDADARQGSGAGRNKLMNHMQTPEYLHSAVMKVGLESEVTGDQVVLTVNGVDTEHRVFIRWGEHNSVHFTTAWNSPQHDWTDAPTVNTWNHNRKYTRVSITHDATDDRSSLVVMHMDQLVLLVEPEDEPRAQVVIQESLKIFVSHLQSFDRFFIDSYKVAPAQDAETNRREYEARMAEEYEDEA
ncbi:hypothetical protein DIPPA_01018 [Diplonema papillatum]|nr:hypothetical protein DIPPA_01018 [Diplonema papillatum]